MANIDLRTIYRSTTDKLSPVDSKIILNKQQTDKILYSDLKLDLTFNELKERPLNAKDSTHDLLTITNLEAVTTSVKNILNTRLCSRLLNPEMEFDLEQFLFERMDYNVAYFIGYELCTQLPIYEPRVSVETIDIQLDFDNDTYIIDLLLTVPSLNATIKLSSILNSEGYLFV